MERWGHIEHTNGPKLCPFLDRRPLRAPWSALLRGRRGGASEAGGCIFFEVIEESCWVNFIAPPNLCCLVLELTAFRPTAVFQSDSSKLPCPFCVLRRKEPIVSRCQLCASKLSSFTVTTLSDTGFYLTHHHRPMLPIGVLPSSIPLAS